MSKTKKLTLCAILIALALALSYTERFIPLQMVVPLPGVKVRDGMLDAVMHCPFVTASDPSISLPALVLGSEVITTDFKLSTPSAALKSDKVKLIFSPLCADTIIGSCAAITLKAGESGFFPFSLADAVGDSVIARQTASARAAMCFILLFISASVKKISSVYKIHLYVFGF